MSRKVNVCGQEVFYESKDHAKTVREEVGQCTDRRTGLGLQCGVDEYPAPSGKVVYLYGGFLSGTNIRVRVPAAYPDEPAIVDGYVLKSLPTSSHLLELCEALHAEIGRSPVAQPLVGSGLSGEVNPEGYRELDAQHGRHDAELAEALQLAAVDIPEGTPPYRMEPEPQPQPQRELEPEPELDQTCRVLDLTSGLFARLTDAGFAEIPRQYPKVVAIFLGPNTQVTDVGLDKFRSQIPRVRCLSLGGEVARESLIQLLRKYARTKCLDLQGDDCAKLTRAGLTELCALCPGLLKIFTRLDSKFDQQFASSMCSSNAGYARRGNAISVSVYAVATRAKHDLDSLQEQLRQSASDADCEHRNTKRKRFISAVDALSMALEPGSALANHIHMLEAGVAVDGEELEPQPRVASGLPGDHGLHNITQQGQGQGLQSSELSAWSRIQEQAQQLKMDAAECADVVRANEPKRSIAALRELQGRNKGLRAVVRQRQYEVEEARVLEAESSDALESSGDRQALLAQPMSVWSEAQVQQWIALIGLPLDRVQVVQQVLADDKFEGEDLQQLGCRQLQKLLMKSGVTHAECVTLAEQTLSLHKAAQGRTQLAAAKERLRESIAATRKQLVELVNLARQHFPELMHSHEDVRVFIGSDGLQLTDRHINDYDDRCLKKVGRFKLYHAKYNGVDVMLKQFPFEDDMSAYLKEKTNVLKLFHRHIIRYSAIFECEGSMYIEMEYCNYGSLTQWLETTHPDAVKKQSVLRQVLLALAYMHGQNVVHCDIKGDNVLVAADETARVCDFEMSKDAKASASTMIGGTEGYIAPELRQGCRPSPASDMYAFGVLVLNTLYPQASGDPLLTDASTVPGAPDWVCHLVHQDPARRLTAVQLQARPYFEVDKVVERRAQEAEKAAAQQLANAESQVAWAQMVQTRAAEGIAAANQKQAEAARAVAQAASIEDQVRRDMAQQAAEARVRMARVEASKRECIICFESFLPEKGIRCHATDSDPHFLCGECFAGHVKEQSETEAMDLLEQRGGCVFCPMRQYGCEQTLPFTDADVARYSSDEVFRLYTQAKIKLVETKLAKEIGAAERARFTAEIGRLAAAATRRAAEAQQAAVVAEAQAQRVVARAKQQVVRIPTYWKNQDLDSDIARFCSRYQVERVQDAMRRSSTDPGAASLANCCVHRVERVENMVLWQRYQHQKQELHKKLKKHQPLQLAGRPKLPLLDICDRTIDQTANEFWLWHGTAPAVADILALEGFDERVANTNGLYGAGSYFADASSKSHQYSRKDSNGHYCMLYCRVIMGSPYMTNRQHNNERRPPDNPAFAQSGIPHDSIMAEGGVARFGHQINNEYVVFRPGQAYPEYIIWYTK
jgi:serine/threonine protein kinase